VAIDQLERSILGGGRESLPSVKGHGFLVFKHENQGVCKWGILLNGSADPPMYVDFDSGFNSPAKCADSFSSYVYSCAWDYSQVLLADSLLLQAQNGPLSEAAHEFLCQNFNEELMTYGWPGERQFRFSKGDQRVLNWADRAQARLVGACKHDGVLRIFGAPS